MRVNGLNILNETELNDIKQAKWLFNGCLGEYRVNLVKFYMHKFIYWSLVY
jgi:hypothetical protein